MKVLYTAVVTNTGGRSGKAYSTDGKFEVNVAMPVEMGGKDPDATNPEQLFAAGYSSCFNGALELVLRKNRVRFESTQLLPFHFWKILRIMASRLPCMQARPRESARKRLRST